MIPECVECGEWPVDEEGDCCQRCADDYFKDRMQVTAGWLSR